MEVPVEHPKAATLDLSNLLLPPPDGMPLHATRQQDHQLERTLDARLIEACRPAIEDGREVRGSWPVANSNRAVGTMLGSEVTRRYGGAGLPARHHRPRAHRFGGPELSALSCRQGSLCACTATPTTTWARAFPVAA